MQLMNEQHIFINNVYAERKSLNVQNEFEQKFTERSSPTRKTVWKTVNKFRTHGTISNLNKGNSRRLKTVRTNENIERVRQVITENPEVSNKRNDTELPSSSFQRIVRNDLQYYPYRAKVKQQLLEGDYPRRLRFAHWFAERPASSYKISMSKEKVSLWLGLCGIGSVIEPFFYATTLNGDKYLQMLNTEIIPQLQIAYGRNLTVFGRWKMVLPHTEH
ncbi:Protein of unknown function DUF4817 [Trinorchestia longiramus]|nr:Protein of unknown function DUF4817 [Trinorchestia longiramus]